MGGVIDIKYTSKENTALTLSLLAEFINSPNVLSIICIRGTSHLAENSGNTSVEDTTKWFTHQQLQSAWINNPLQNGETTLNYVIIIQED